MLVRVRPNPAMDGGYVISRKRRGKRYGNTHFRYFALAAGSGPVAGAGERLERRPGTVGTLYLEESEDKVSAWSSGSERRLYLRRVWLDGRPWISVFRRAAYPETARRKIVEFRRTRCYNLAVWVKRRPFARTLSLLEKGSYLWPMTGKPSYKRRPI